MNSLRSAIGFLTILPVAPRDATGGLASARAWFPVVGLILGAILAIADMVLDYGGLPHLMSAIILIILLIALTRALHLDGFMDCCDALFGGFDRERRLEILRDPHVGAFAVTGVVSLLLLKVGAVASLPSNERIWVILIFPCLSRWAAVLVMDRFPYVRSEGIATPFLKSGARGQIAFALVVTLAASLVLAGPVGAALVGVVSLVAWAVGVWASKQLGGVTGDVYGTVIEVTEASALLVSVILARNLPFSVSPPPLWLLE